jgi:hypothetical protein
MALQTRSETAIKVPLLILKLELKLRVVPSESTKRERATNSCHLGEICGLPPFKESISKHE